MIKEFIPYSEALNLYCLLMCKYQTAEGIMFTDEKAPNKPEKQIVSRKWSMKDLTDFTLLEEILEASSYIHYVEAVSTKMFGASNKKLLYELGLKIRNKQPVSLSEYQMNLIKKYLADSKLIIRTENVVDFELTEKQKVYQNTEWVVYFYDEIKSVKEDIVCLSTGITRALVRLGMFGKVEIDSYSTYYDQPECYHGNYHFYGSSAYLTFDLRTESNEKLLRMELAIGKNSKLVELALGQYHNIDGAIYSGTVIMLPLKGGAREEFSPAFIPAIEASNHPEIPNFVWQYLEEKNLNRIRVKFDIFSSSRLITWMKEKRNGRKS